MRGCKAEHGVPGLSRLRIHPGSLPVPAGSPIASPKGASTGKGSEREANTASGATLSLCSQSKVAAISRSLLESLEFQQVHLRKGIASKAQRENSLFGYKFGIYWCFQNTETHQSVRQKCNYLQRSKRSCALNRKILSPTIGCTNKIQKDVDAPGTCPLSTKHTSTY